MSRLANISGKEAAKAFGKAGWKAIDWWHIRYF
jgi:predicted RNA binding protein YcfA (HicA-like mRNA interferase family)